MSYLMLLGKCPICSRGIFVNNQEWRSASVGFAVSCQTNNCSGSAVKAWSDSIPWLNNEELIDEVSA